jgi:MFS transporter, BCD family, chlorophyll transporter
VTRDGRLAIAPAAHHLPRFAAGKPDDSTFTMSINPRLLRLSLFQFGLGFSVVVFTGTLNRVLITEEDIPATVVGWLLSLSLFVAPIRVLLGERSDRKKQKFGYRRLPYVWIGSMMVFSGLSAAPFCLIFLSKSSEIGQGTTPFALGVLFSTIIFLVYAIGMHIAQTGYLALVTDVIPKRDRHNAVAFLWIALIVGQIVSALIIGWYLADYKPVKLIEVMQSSSLVFVILAVAAIWKQDVAGMFEGSEDTTVSRLRNVLSTPRNKLFFLIVFVGTFAITGQDVLLEPYGGQILGMSVNETTRLTAVLGGGMLLAMIFAARAHRRFATPLHMAVLACGVGVIGFGLIIGTSLHQSVPLFATGAGVIGVANGLFLISTLSIVMALAETDTAGLYVGLWGLVQTTATGIGTLIGGLTRDTAMRASQSLMTGYTTFYSVELVLTIVTAVLLIVMLRMRSTSQDLFQPQPQNQSVFVGLTDIPGG